MATQVAGVGSSRACTPEGQRLPAPSSPPPLRRKVSPVPYCTASAPRSLAALLAGWPAGPDATLRPNPDPNPSMARMPGWPALAAPAAQPLSAGGLPCYGAARWPVAGELPPAAASAAAARLLSACSRCGTGGPQGNVLTLLGLRQSVCSWGTTAWLWDVHLIAFSHRAC